MTENRWRGRFAWSALCLALILYPALLWRYIGANSAVFDEGMHIAAGYRYWQCADYGINPEHPPLAKLVAAAPIRHWQLGEFTGPCGTSATSNAQLLGIGYRLMNSPRAEELLRAARTAMMVFPILLLLTVFFATRAWFGPLAAGWAVLLTVFEPNLTAHGVLVATDMAVTATTLLAVFLAWRYLRRPGILRMLLLGLAMGLALSAKHSGILVPVIVFLVFLTDAPGRPENGKPGWRSRAAGWAGACIIAVLVLWSTYQFRYRALPSAHAATFGIVQGAEQSGMARTWPGKLLVFASARHLLPESYVGGLIYVVDNSTRETFLFGRQLAESVWYYFPAAISIKTPLTLLFLVLAALATPGFWRRYGGRCWMPGVPVGVFLLFAMSAGMGLGIRHVLPIYPFLIILAAAGAAYFSTRFRWAVPVCAALVLFQAVSYLRSFPNQIAYANEAWGGPARLRFYLGDSNIDWGQSLPQLKHYVATHGLQDCWVAWFGMRKPEQAGVPCRALAGPAFLEAADVSLPPPLPERFGGTVFLSVTLLDYDLFPYRWFRSRQPDDVIGGDLLVFRGDFELPAVAAERRVARGWWFLNHGEARQAVEEFTAAEPYANSRGTLHSLFGWALASVGRLADARASYEHAARDYEGRPGDAAFRRAALAQAEAIRRAESGGNRSPQAR